MAKIYFATIYGLPLGAFSTKKKARDACVEYARSEIPVQRVPAGAQIDPNISTEHDPDHYVNIHADNISKIIELVVDESKIDSVKAVTAHLKGL